MILRAYLGTFGHRIVCPKCGQVGKGSIIFATSRRVFVWSAIDKIVRHATESHDGQAYAVELVNDPRYAQFVAAGGYPQPGRRRDDRVIGRFFRPAMGGNVFDGPFAAKVR